MEEDEIRDNIWDFCWLSGLKNAVEFGGTPNKKAIKGKVMRDYPELRSYAMQVNSIVDEIIEEISSLSLEEQERMLLNVDPSALDKKEKIKEEKELPELPNLDKYDKLIMRLAPYPSGALHIGNARMVVLNNEYVNKHEGEVYLFYDDTIGSPKSLRNTPKAKYVLPEAYDLIKDGLEWLGVKYTKIFYKSDRLELYYEYCEKLIKDEMAYVCSCTAGDFKNKYKDQKKSFPHRDQSVEKNLEEWRNMLGGKYEETTAVVRLKTGMDQKDPAVRDNIIMRISEAEHPRVGNKYLVWPMLEFSWAFDDHLIGVTHIIRGADLIKEDFIEDFIWDHFGWKKAEFLHYGRIKFPNMKLSKTDARNNIQEGLYDGWDDPRTWSLQSLKKRGFKPEALKESLLSLGMSLSGITFSTGWLYSKNKDMIDEISDRYFFVENPVLLDIDEVPFEEYMAEPLLLPSNPKKGKRIIKGKVSNKKLKILISKKDANKLKVGQILRLKDLINIQILSIDMKNNKISSYYHSLELNREYSIIHWVPNDNKIKVKILKPDGFVSSGYGEINLKSVPLNTPIQFERYGFVNPIKLENNELFCYFTH